MPQEVFDQIAAALTADRAAYFTEWNKNFFNLDETLGSLISAEVVQDAWNTAVGASAEGTIACMATWPRTSATTCGRSTSRSSSCMARPTASCRSRPAARVRATHPRQ